MPENDGTIPVVGVCRSRAFCMRLLCIILHWKWQHCRLFSIYLFLFPLPSVQDLPVSSFHYLLFKVYLFHLSTAFCSRFTCFISALPSVQDWPVSPLHYLLFKIYLFLSSHYLLFKIYLFHLFITYCPRFTCFIFPQPSVQDLPVSSLHYLLSKIYLFHLSTTFSSRFTCFISLQPSVQDLPVPSSLCSRFAVTSSQYWLFKIYLFRLPTTFCSKFTCFIFPLLSVQIYLFHLPSTVLISTWRWRMNGHNVIQHVFVSSVGQFRSAEKHVKAVVCPTLVLTLSLPLARHMTS